MEAKQIIGTGLKQGGKKERKTNIQEELAPLQVEVGPPLHLNWRYIWGTLMVVRGQVLLPNLTAQLREGAGQITKRK